jgi:multiple sugar transport system substrate-binding protein
VEGETRGNAANKEISRREVLRLGLVGAAGLTGLPAVLAACGFGSSAPSAALSLGRPDFYTSEGASPDTIDAFDALVAAFKAQNPGVSLRVSTIDTLAMDPSVSEYRQYLKSKPDDLFTWTSSYDWRYAANNGLLSPIDDVWDRVRGNFAPGLTRAMTGSDGHIYGVPVDSGPWAFFYRKSVWDAHGYTVPETFDQLLALCERMQKDRLTPIALGNRDGWPATSMFDILNLRLNGYDFHMRLLAGQEKWTDPRVLSIFETWRKLVPYYSPAATLQTWQEACDKLVRGETGMSYIGLFMTNEVEQADASVLADIRLFAFPYFGNAYDTERAVEAPLDVWAMCANSPTLQVDLAKAQACLASFARGATQLQIYRKHRELIPTAADTERSELDSLSLEAFELVSGAQRLTQGVREFRPDFAGADGIQSWLMAFLRDPSLDLAVFTAGIQQFWDMLPPYI